MARKILGKFLDYIGLEETELEEDMLEEEEPELEYEEPELYEPRQGASRTERKSKLVQMPGNATMKMIVYQPSSYSDTQSIIDNIKSRKPVVINLETLEYDVAQRVLDFISGALYALNGSIFKVSKSIFVLAPSNVGISGNVADDTKSKGLFNLNTASHS